MYSFCSQISLPSCHDIYKIHPKQHFTLRLNSLIGDAFVIWVFYNTQAGCCFITRTSIVTGVIGSGRIVWPYVRHGGSFRFRRITSIPPKPFAKPNAFSLVENITYIKAKARSPGNQRACWFPRPAVVLYKSIQIAWLQAKRPACCCFP